MNQFLAGIALASATWSIYFTGVTLPSGATLAILTLVGLREYIRWMDS